MYRSAAFDMRSVSQIQHDQQQNPSVQTDSSNKVYINHKWRRPQNC